MALVEVPVPPFGFPTNLLNIFSRHQLNQNNFKSSEEITIRFRAERKGLYHEQFELVFEQLPSEPVSRPMCSGLGLVVLKGPLQRVV